MKEYDCSVDFSIWEGTGDVARLCLGLDRRCSFSGGCCCKTTSLRTK